MRNTITVMNAKGGVGKSTLVLALAETLANDSGKKILVIDADAQASISHMLMRQEELESVQSRNRTFVDFLITAALKREPARWQDFVVSGVSDVDDARSIDLLPSDTHLTLFEREVSRGDHEVWLRRTVGELLDGGPPPLRPRAHRQRARPVGADRELAARGRLLSLAHAARLHLHAGPQVPARVPGARRRTWALPSAWAWSST